MSQLILKLKNDRRVCVFCEFVEFAFFLTAPVLLPLAIIYASYIG